VNIISKSGGNDVHGSWFYDIYNQDMAARPEYVTKEEHPPIDRKRTGGSAGGLFKKDKMFWFHRFRQWRCIESGQALGGPGGPPPQDGALKANVSNIVVLWAPASRPARSAKVHGWLTPSDPSLRSSV
jgi:hypothetical protein